ncbi:hypothetical protein, partial [Ruegeria faecimaris]|uniref:hypothetical protein n=1 Tax=Ruegeria faecimaris TaxID=686389 RepID=UPI002490FDF4
NHHLNGSQANDALTIKLNQSDEAAQQSIIHKGVAVVLALEKFDVRFETLSLWAHTGRRMRCSIR